MGVVGRRVRGLAFASHLAPTVVVTTLAGALAVGVGASARTTATVAAAVLAGQLSIGWSNDWLDARRDLAVGRSDKPVVTGLVTPQGLRRSALAALAVCAVLSFLPGWRAGVVHLAAVSGGWLYNGWLKGTAWSWLPFAVSFGLLPVFVVLALPGSPTTAPWTVAAAALLGVGAHLANVLPDLEDDELHGIRGVGHRLGRTTTSLLAPAVLLLAVAVLILAPTGSPVPVVWVLGVLAALLALAAGAVAVTRTRSRLPFALTMAVAGLCLVLLVVSAGQVVVRS